MLCSFNMFSSLIVITEGKGARDYKNTLVLVLYNNKYTHIITFDEYFNIVLRQGGYALTPHFVCMFVGLYICL